mmetsp:Transcript_35067/g.63110  ORF Transcript_35067/g.63110 Transcript_35067/m.63110 type:complete len:87 (+) Transcript_35067:3107-3367(+)
MKIYWRVRKRERDEKEIIGRDIRYIYQHSIQARNHHDIWTVRRLRMKGTHCQYYLLLPSNENDPGIVATRTDHPKHYRPRKAKIVS